MLIKKGQTISIEYGGEQEEALVTKITRIGMKIKFKLDVQGVLQSFTEEDLKRRIGAIDELEETDLII